ADHSTRGAFSDLLNVLPLLEPGAVIVVDDYDHPPVAAGVQALLAVLAPSTRHLRIANYRGHMLIWPNGQRPELAAAFCRLPAWAAALIEIEDMVLAVRQTERAIGVFTLRARSALAAELVGLLGEALDRKNGDNPRRALLPTGAMPGLTT